VRLLEKAIDSIQSELVLLAPEPGVVPVSFKRTYPDWHRYAGLLAKVQRLRGSVYLEDGAIAAAQLTSDGRYVQAVDRESWHLLALDPHGQVRGCARYRHHSGGVDFYHLGVRNSAIARCPRYGGHLRASVEREIGEAARRGIGFAEVGGWAIAPENRFTIEALRIALGAYGLAQILGGCLGITTATVRHRSSTILRRIGGRSLESSGVVLPPYYDPQYGCQMEVLRFDAGEPDAAYRSCVEALRKMLRSIHVVSAPRPEALPAPKTVPALPVLEPMPWPALHQFS
jgi:hypothetical protein